MKKFIKAYIAASVIFTVLCLILAFSPLKLPATTSRYRPMAHFPTLDQKIQKKEQAIANNLAATREYLTEADLKTRKDARPR